MTDPNNPSYQPPQQYPQQQPPQQQPPQQYPPQQQPPQQYPPQQYPQQQQPPPQQYPQQQQPPQQQPPPQQDSGGAGGNIQSVHIHQTHETNLAGSQGVHGAQGGGAGGDDGRWPLAVGLWVAMFGIGFLLGVVVPGLLEDDATTTAATAASTTTTAAAANPSSSSSTSSSIVAPAAATEAPTDFTTPYTYQDLRHTTDALNAVVPTGWQLTEGYLDTPGTLQPFIQATLDPRDTDNRRTPYLFASRRLAGRATTSDQWITNNIARPAECRSQDGSITDYSAGLQSYRLVKYTDCIADQGRTKEIWILVRHESAADSNPQNDNVAVVTAGIFDARDQVALDRMLESLTLPPQLP